VLRVVEGSGLAQARGGPVEEIRAGDSVEIGADEEHWHGAGPGTFMTHIAVQEADEEGATAYWGEQVSDEEYRARGAGS
jgi:quercetin dioxygenase-like cupin family protein